MPDEPITETGEPKPLWPEFADEDARAAEPEAPQTVKSFPRAISGQWIFDPDRSEIDALSDIDIEKDIIVKIEPNGDWLAAAPLISARIANDLVPNLSIALRLAVRGRLSIESGPDAKGRFLAKTTPAEIVEQQYAIGDGKKAADMTAAVAPFLRMFLADISAGGMMALGTDHDDRLLTLETSGSSGTQVFRRPTLTAKMETLRYVNDHKQVRTPTGFDTPEGVAKGTNYGDPGVPVVGPHYTRTMTAAASFTHSETIVAEVGLTIGPAGTKFRLIGRCPPFDYLCFESEAVVATGSPQFVLVQARQKLPQLITSRRVMIKWHAKSLGEDGAWANLGESGPHVIYTLFGPPLPGPSGKANHPTPMRLNFMMNAINYENAFPYIKAGSASWQDGLNRRFFEFLIFEAIAGSAIRPAALPFSRVAEAPIWAPPVDEEAISAMSGDFLWSLLDLAKPQDGLIGEAGELLNLMRAMIGIPGFCVLPGRVPD